MRPRAAVLAVLAVAAGGYVLALRAQPRIYSVRGATMGTTYSVKYVSVELDPRVRPAVQAALDEIDAHFNVYDPDSEVSRFNARAGDEPFAASGAFAGLLRRALRIAAATEGAFDPTVRPLVALYGFEAKRFHRPSPDELAAALLRVGYRKVSVDDQDRVHTTVPGVQLDFNAFAKGHGVDLVLAAVQALGIDDCMVEIGGEVRCAGRKPDGTPWRIGIERPAPVGQQPSEVEEVVEVRDFAIASSGSYRNYLATGGEVVHHILDPRTGRNAPSPVAAVAVRASTCALADALATAFMVRGAGGAENVLARCGDARLGVLFSSLREGGQVVRHEVSWRP